MEHFRCQISKDNYLIKKCCQPNKIREWNSGLEGIKDHITLENKFAIHGSG